MIVWLVKVIVESLHEWQIKIARVMPLYKHGNPSQFINYRPVAVLDLFWKVYGLLFYNRLLKYLFKYKILYLLDEKNFQPNLS